MSFDLRTINSIGYNPRHEGAHIPPNNIVYIYSSVTVVSLNLRTDLLSVRYYIVVWSKKLIIHIFSRIEIFKENSYISYLNRFMLKY